MKRKPERNYFSIKHRKIQIKIVGVGGGGGNIADWLVRNSVLGDVICVDTDPKALAKRLTLKKFRMTLLGSPHTGAYGFPAWGEKAALRSIGQLERIFVEADVAVLVSTVGGGTGSGAMPVMAKAARSMGALTVVMATTPFKHEGSTRNEEATKAMRSLKALADIWVEVSNEEVSKVYDAKDLADLFAVPDRVCYLCVWILREILKEKGDLTILRDKGKAVIGWGSTVTAALRNTWPRQDIHKAKLVMGLSVGEAGPKGSRNFQIMNRHLKRQLPGAERFLTKRIVRRKIEEEYRVALLATEFDGE